MKLRNKKTGEIIIPTDYTFATNDDGIINYLKNENAYLRGVIKAYEKVLRSKGYLEEEQCES